MKVADIFNAVILSRDLEMARSKLFFLNTGVMTSSTE